MPLIDTIELIFEAADVLLESLVTPITLLAILISLLLYLE